VDTSRTTRNSAGVMVSNISNMHVNLDIPDAIKTTKSMKAIKGTALYFGGFSFTYQLITGDLKYTSNVKSARDEFLSNYMVPKDFVIQDVQGK
jgi:hypothetical protein